MTSPCQPLPLPVAEEMLQVVTRAICDRPGDNSNQRESRTRQMVHSVLGFEPRDGLEYMLSTVAFGHFLLILDSMRDVFQGQADAMKAKTKTTIVALDRTMLEMIKELRVVRRRPVSRSAEDARREQVGPPAASVTPSEPVAAMPVRTVAPDVAVEPAAETPVPSQPSHSGPSSSELLALAQAVTGLTASKPAKVEPTHATPVVSGSGEAGARLAASAVDPFDISGFISPPSGEADEGTFEDHIAAFEAAFHATMETLVEARELEAARTEAASGD
jgi:hypothetical protein